MLQFVLLGVIAVVGILGRGGWPEGARGVTTSLGVALLLAGAVQSGLGLVRLGSALTAVPAPLADRTLRTSGIYRLVRHPIYGGLVLGSLGLSLLTTPWALLPTATLAVVLDLKRRVEEEFLASRYPGYAEYCRQVPRALVPWVW